MDNLDFRSARLLEVRPETKDIDTYVLTMEDEGGLRYSPGQFNMIGFPGFEEAAISFSSLSENGGLEFSHTIRRVGNVTNRVARVQEGDSVMIRGPFGKGWPIEEMRGGDILLAAGGIGFAPLRPLVPYWLERPDQRGKLILLIGAKTPDEMIFRDELLGWQEREGIETSYWVDRLENTEHPGINLNQGLITEGLKGLRMNLSNTVACICGPEIMMRFAARDLIRYGCRTDKIYVSMERRMRCGTAHCGHCQIGSKFVCQDGPVFRFPDIARFSDTLL
jgi:NAD(P)H-flavin reductase